MIRLFENVVKSNVRCLVRSVHNVLGSPSPPNAPRDVEQQQQSPHHRHQQQQEQQQGHDNARNGGDSDTASFGDSLPRPSLVCAGVATAAGAHLSRLAFEWWRDWRGRRDVAATPATEVGSWRWRVPLIFSRFMLGGSALHTSFSVCDAAGKTSKSTGAVKARKDDQLGHLLDLSLEEACDRVNREGATFAGKGEWSKALECFKSAASEGHPPALYNLGLYFHTVSVDLSRARTFYSEAAAAGHREAAYNLSTILMSEESQEWEAHMQSAARGGLVNAQTYLGSFYFERGDFAKARRYFGMGLASTEARSPGDVENCSYWLGRCYEAEGVTPMAELWYAQVRKTGGFLANDAEQRSARLGQARMRLSKSAVTFARLRELAEDETRAVEVEETELGGGVNFFVPIEPPNHPSEGRFEDEEEGWRFHRRSIEPLRRSQSVARCLG